VLTTANFALPDFVSWYNESWFAKGPNAARLVPEKGYVAPPLDGIWSSAPYLHNGSVPTIEGVLNSEYRPRIWKRSFRDNDYDYDRLGWNFVEVERKEDKFAYDTSLRGYGNAGHYFGDHLTLTERSEILEFLKTL
jgi:hypothetical protein